MSIKNLLSSKKAQEAGEIPIFGRKMIFFAITAIILGLLAVGYIMSTSAYVFKMTSTPKGLQDELYANRLFNNPSCFAYQDPNTQRVYPYWIDLRKFTDERFSACLRPSPSRSDRCYDIRLARLASAEGHLNMIEEQVRTVRSSNYAPSCTEGSTITVAKRMIIIIDSDSGSHSSGTATIYEYIRQGQAGSVQAQQTGTGAA